MPTKPFPGFDHLFQLRDPISDAVFRGRWEAAVDPLEIKRGESAAENPITIRWAMGDATPSDVVWTTSVYPIIVHRRVIDILQEVNCTGWRSYPVKLFDKASFPRDDYSSLQIVGRCGPINLERSAVVLKQYPAGWYPHLQGHYFDETSWDGSDIFMHAPDAKDRSTGEVLVAEEVREAFQQAKIQNVSFQRLTDVSVTSLVYEVGLADLLPDDFQQRVDAAYAKTGVPRPERTPKP